MSGLSKVLVSQTGLALVCTEVRDLGMAAVFFLVPEFQPSRSLIPGEGGGGNCAQNLADYSILHFLRSILCSKSCGLFYSTLPKKYSNNSLTHITIIMLSNNCQVSMLIELQHE